MAPLKDKLKINPRYSQDIDESILKEVEKKASIGIQIENMNLSVSKGKLQNNLKVREAFLKGRAKLCCQTHDKIFSIAMCDEHPQQMQALTFLAKYYCKSTTAIDDAKIELIKKDVELKQKAIKEGTNEVKNSEISIKLI